MVIEKVAKPGDIHNLFHHRVCLTDLEGAAVALEELCRNVDCAQTCATEMDKASKGPQVCESSRPTRSANTTSFTRRVLISISV